MDLGHPVRRPRVDTPLEHVAIDHERAGNLAVPVPLFDRADIDEQGASSHSRAASGAVTRARVDRANARISSIEAIGKRYCETTQGETDPVHRTL